jgi:RNA polymerase sigma factor (sigma-70 family)
MPQPDPTFRSELAAEACKLHALARRLVHDGDADDLAQDTFVLALTQDDRPRSLSSWLRQVLRNEHRSRVRSLLRRRAREQRSPAPETPYVATDAAAQAEILGAVRDVVHALDEPYRQVLHARFFEDRSAADIARAEGCPAATVRWRVQEGLRLTRRKLDERFDGRSQWVGALVVLAGVPAAPSSTAMASAGEPMNKLMLLKALTATAAIAATGTIVVTATTPDAAAEVAIEQRVDARAPLEAALPAPRAAAPAAVAAMRRAAEPAEDGDRDDAPAADGNDPDAPDCAGEHDHIECQGPPPGAVDVDANPWATEADARDPMDAIKELSLPRRGAADAKVRIVECAEFDCPFCDKARASVDRIEADFGDRVSVHWMHNPLPFHPGADVAARAAHAAGNQGKFWEMHDLLFDEPKARTDADMTRLAGTLGLDEARFATDFSSDDTRKAIDEQKATCLGNGAKGTPSFFIDGDLIVGARPYEELRTIIEDELAD